MTTPGGTGAVAPEPPSRLNYGAPQDNDDIFKPRGDGTASPSNSTASRTNPDAIRRAARDRSRDGDDATGLFQLPLPSASPDQKLSEAIDKAQKPDCRHAFAAMGLLAIPALVASTVGNGNCRW